MPIMLSEKAAGEIKNIIADQGLPADETRLRVGIKGGGCSGFSYLLDLTEEPKSESDEEMDSHGVKILVDTKSYPYLDGVEIDFKDEMLSKGFVFKNPNAAHTCGCGSSFSASGEEGSGCGEGGCGCGCGSHGHGGGCCSDHAVA